MACANSGNQHQLRMCIDDFMVWDTNSCPSMCDGNRHDNIYSQEDQYNAEGHSRLVEEKDKDNQTASNSK